MSEITIFCDNESDRHGKKHPNPIVHRYRYDDSSKDGIAQGWLDAKPSKRLKNAEKRGRGAQTLVGSERFDPKKFTLDNREEWASSLRESWALECEKCGYRVPIKGSKLYPVLHRMREIGVSHIGLSALEDGLVNR